MVTVKITVFSYVKPCRLVAQYQSSENCAHIFLFYLEDVGSMVFRNTDNSLFVHGASTQKQGQHQYRIIVKPLNQQ